MPNKIEAVQCHQCKKLHPIEGAYITVHNLSVEEHRSANPSYATMRREVEIIKATDVIVCDNGCLRNLVTLKSIKDSSD